MTVFGIEFAHPWYLAAALAVVPVVLLARFAAAELYLRGMTNHFPSTLVFRNGKLLDRVIVGVLSAEHLAREIRALQEHAP